MPLDGAQGTFDFFDGPPDGLPRAERLFFGLFPASETAVGICGLTDEILRRSQARGSRIRPDRLHLSLHHIGDYSRLTSGIIYGPVQAGNAVKFHPFQIALRSVTSFDPAPTRGGAPRKRPTVLLGEGDDLREFHRVLGAAMRGIGLKTHDLFAPHVTLFYGDEPVPSQEIEPIRMTVDRFFLIHSRVGLTEYRILGCWPLTG